MAAIPHRSSLVAEVTEILRRGIEVGEWKDRLPGELSLCERLKVSRTTIRGALGVLKCEGWIIVSQGRQMQIAQRLPRAAARTSSKVVGLLSIQPTHMLSSFSHFVISELQDYLHGAGYSLEVHADLRFAARHPARSLSQLKMHSRAECWVLLPPTTACANWFADQRTRCLVVGSREWSATFPSVDVDLHAVSRHAVGILLGRGHSCIALIVTKVAGPGQNSIEEGFRQGFPNKSGDDAAKPMVIRVSDVVSEIKTTLASMLASSDRPTALLVARPKHVLTVMSHLAITGVRVPQDVSVICLGHDPYLDNLTPTVAHYSFNWKSFARRVSVLVRELVDSGNLPCREHLVIPQFKPGETLRPVPK